MFKWWLFTIFINIHKFIIQRQFLCLNYFKNTLSNMIVYCTITGSLKTIDSWQISRGFMKFQVKNTHISWFHDIGFKIPLFSWNLEHPLDHKCPWRVVTGIGPSLSLTWIMGTTTLCILGHIHISRSTLFNQYARGTSIKQLFRPTYRGIWQYQNIVYWVLAEIFAANLFGVFLGGDVLIMLNIRSVLELCIKYKLHLDSEYKNGLCVIEHTINYITFTGVTARMPGRNTNYTSFTVLCHIITVLCQT